MGAAYHVQAEYRQFYLMDAKLQPPMPEAISDEDLVARVRVAPNIVVVHTLEEGLIPVTVEIASTAPSPNIHAWNHIVEFSIEAPSGALILGGSAAYLPSAPRIEVGPGPLRGRVEFRSSNGTEACRIVLWPGAIEPRRVLKQNAS